MDDIDEGIGSNDSNDVVVVEDGSKLKPVVNGVYKAVDIDAVKSLNGRIRPDFDHHVICIDENNKNGNSEPRLTENSGKENATGNTNKNASNIRNDKVNTHIPEEVIVLDDSDTSAGEKSIQKSSQVDSTPSKTTQSTMGPNDTTPQKLFSYVLNEKTRNSLKGLVTKVQSSPDKKITNGSATETDDNPGIPGDNKAGLNCGHSSDSKDLQNQVKSENRSDPRVEKRLDRPSLKSEPMDVIHLSDEEESTVEQNSGESLSSSDIKPCPSTLSKQRQKDRKCSDIKDSHKSKLADTQTSLNNNKQENIKKINKTSTPLNIPVDSVRLKDEGASDKKNIQSPKCEVVLCIPDETDMDISEMEDRKPTLKGEPLLVPKKEAHTKSITLPNTLGDKKSITSAIKSSAPCSDSKMVVDLHVSESKNNVHGVSTTLSSGTASGNTGEDKQSRGVTSSKGDNPKASLSADRKRPADDDDDDDDDATKSNSDIEAKRSRLDIMIGKLESQIGNTSTESIETVEGSDTDTVPEETRSSPYVTAVSDDDEEEEDETGGEKFITLTKEALDDLLEKKVREYIYTERDKLVLPLLDKINELQSSNDYWKNVVRNIQGSVNDVTVLQQKHEKRKAATAALRQITTRNVAIQVDESKPETEHLRLRSQQGQTPPKANNNSPRVNNQTPTKPSTVVKVVTGAHSSPVQSTAKITSPPSTPILTPTGTNGTIRLPIPQSAIPTTTSLLTAPVPLPGQLVSSTPVFSVPRLVSGIAAPTTANAVPNQAAITASNATMKQILDGTVRHLVYSSNSVVQSPDSVVTSSGPVMLNYQPRILTGAPGTGQNNYIAIQSTAGNPMSTMSVSQAKTAAASTNLVSTSAYGTAQIVSGAATGNMVKVIDLTMDEDANKARVVQLPGGGVSLIQPPPVKPGTQGSVGNAPGSIILSSPLGAQLVPTATLSQGQPGAYQLVFKNSPGNLVRVVSSTQNPLSSGIPTVVTQQLGGGQTAKSTIVQPNTVTAGQPSQFGKGSTQVITVPLPTKSSVGTTNKQSTKVTTSTTVTTVAPKSNTHPAPFPPMPPSQSKVGLKSLPPKPTLKISRVSQGIVLSWNMSQAGTTTIATYQLFAYQEGNASPNTSLWKKVGDVKALPLPMACTLTQFQEGHKYHFAVRAMDTSNLVGLFSDASSIHLVPLKQ